MLPKTGPISLDDINTEFGYPANTLHTWTGVISLMRTWDEVSPIEMNEWRGYDVDWLGWTIVSGYLYTENIPPVDSELRLTVLNNSQYATKSGTVYYRFMYSGNPVQSGSMTFTSLGTNSSVNVYDTFGSGFPYDDLQVRFSTSASWQSIL